MDGASEIRERLARLEYAEERASADREEMKAEVKAVRSDVSDIKAILEQVKGGTKVAWVAYGLIGSIAAGITWLLSKITVAPK